MFKIEEKNSSIELIDDNILINNEDFNKNDIITNDSNYKNVQIKEVNFFNKKISSEQKRFYGTPEKLIKISTNIKIFLLDCDQKIFFK